MDVQTAEFLVGPEGEQLLHEATTLPGDDATRVLTLRKRGLPLERASGVVEVAAARRRARSRFPDADTLFFTADALAQATSPLIAAYHAARLAPLGLVADLGCGVGMDAIRVAEAGGQVLALERDPARLVFARANARVRGVEERITFQEGDVTALDWEADAAYWDPSRREGDRRVSRHADRYEPPLSFLETVRERVSRGGCVKLSPALPDEVLDELDGRVTFLSESRECKEACLWFGAAAEGITDFAAVLLPEEVTVPPGEEFAPGGALGVFVHDPDPALIRAGALGTVAEQESGVRLVSYEDAYLTSDVPLQTQRLALSYRVIAEMPYKTRVLGEWLRAQGVGRLVVKKRHFPKEPDAVAKELGLKGGGTEATLILVREGKGHRALVCEPYQVSS
jgi:SAM-dependent methyltransferase